MRHRRKFLYSCSGGPPCFFGGVPPLGQVSSALSNGEYAVIFGRVEPILHAFCARRFRIFASRFSVFRLICPRFGRKICRKTVFFKNILANFGLCAGFFGACVGLFSVRRWYFCCVLLFFSAFNVRQCAPCARMVQRAKFGGRAKKIGPIFARPRRIWGGN